MWRVRDAKTTAVKTGEHSQLPMGQRHGETPNRARAYEVQVVIRRDHGVNIGIPNRRQMSGGLGQVSIALTGASPVITVFFADPFRKIKGPWHHGTIPRSGMIPHT